MKLVKFDTMAFCKSMLDKIRSISAVMMVFVLVVSQIGMSHAMAAMPDQGSNHAVGHSAKAHTEVHSGNQLDELHSSVRAAKSGSDYVGKMPNEGKVGFELDEQGNHCAALCVSAMLPANLVLSAGSVKNPKFGQTHTFGLSNILAGLKRPPRT